MALVPQNDDGTAAGANAYIDVVAFRAHHTARGVDTASHSDAAVATAIVRATDHMDNRFEYVGRRLRSDQTTAWPRSGARYSDRCGLAEGIPLEVRRACAEYALRALGVELSPDPRRDPSGRGLRSFREKVGPVEQEAEYAGGFEMPRYPAADRILQAAGLVCAGNFLIRG